MRLPMPAAGTTAIIPVVETVVIIDFRRCYCPDAELFTAL